jgi:hypothetical protein
MGKKHKRNGGQPWSGRWSSRVDYKDLFRADILGLCCLCGLLIMAQWPMKPREHMHANVGLLTMSVMFILLALLIPSETIAQIRRMRDLQWRDLTYEDKHEMALVAMDVVALLSLLLVDYGSLGRWGSAVGIWTGSGKIAFLYIQHFKHWWSQRSIRRWKKQKEERLAMRRALEVDRGNDPQA